MAGFTTAMCTSFKAELAQALHNFTITTGHVFKVALGKVSPTGTYGAATVNYTDLTGNSDEVSNSGTGYVLGGFAWTAAQNVTPGISGTTAFWSWSVNPTWTSVSFSTVGCIIYNSTSGSKSVSVHSFGGTQTVSSGTLILVLPSNDSTNAILRIT